MNTVATTQLYDVVAISIESNKVRIMATGKDLRNAEAIVTMAVIRRGVDKEFFAEVKSGSYSDGDKWKGLNP